MKRTLIYLAAVMTASFCFADITTAPWIAMQPDDTIIAPLVHSPFVKKTFGEKKTGMYTLPMLRRVFEMPKKKKIETATLQVCGLGHFECYLDGQKVGDHFLDPGWSDYRKEAEYVEFDISSNETLNAIEKDAETNLFARIKAIFKKEVKREESRKHVLGVMLGNGFYNIPRERYLKLLGSFGAPKLKLSLTIMYEDGTEQEIQSDTTWQVAPSPITYSSIYGGEDYDASLEQPGWDSDPEFDASRWLSALAVQPAFDIALHKQEGTELVVIDTLKALSIMPKHDKMKGETEDKEVWIYDFGQNMSGIVELTLKQPLQTGQNIRIRPAELLKPNGTLNQKVAQPYLWNYKAPDLPSFITYNSSHTTHNAAQSWSPRFSYYGFRYVEVQGIHPDSIDLKMLHTSSITCRKPTGHFRCSNDTINRIHDLIDRAIRSNLASVLTDCPTREKLGWLEQDYLMLPSIICRYDVKALYTRLMRQIRDAQQEDGMIPTIAPYYTWFGWGFDDSPEWGAAFILAPWILYQHDGDESLIREYYGDMKRYATYLYSRAREERDSLGQISKPQHIINYGLGDWYDLGPKGPGYSQLTPNGLTATAIYYEELQVLQQMATLLGEPQDAQQYALLSDSVREAYRAKYDTCQSQTALAMGLSLNLLPDSLHSWARERLIEDLATPHTTSDSKGTQHWNTLLTAGDIGYVYLVRTLSDMGQHSELMQLCTNPDIPGYGMQLAKGATSLTESWQALDNVSNNHLMLGHIMEWLYGYVAGIRKIDGQYVIDPAPITGIDWCDCSYMTPNGPIKVKWHKNAKGRIVIDN